jgi:hypothetical protein
MLAWLGGKRKLLEAAKNKGTSNSGYLPALKQPHKERQGAAGRKHTSKRTYQHHIQQHLHDAPCSERQAASSKRLRVVNPTQSIDMLICNSVHVTEEHLPTEVATAEPAAAASDAHADPESSHAEDAAPTAARGAGHHTIRTTKNNNSTSFSTAPGLRAPGTTQPAAPAAPEPTGASQLAGSISSQAATPPPSPLPRRIALTATASGLGHMPLKSSTSNTQDAAPAARCKDWHALLLGGQPRFSHHKHNTTATVGAHDQHQGATTGAYAVLEQQLVQPTTIAKQHQNTQQPASFDLMFLQGGVPKN